MKKFNLNQYIYVKLNDKGKRIIQNHPIYSEYTKVDDKGFYKFPIWEFMKVFNPHLNMGTEIISEENCIYFDENDFKD